MKLLDKILYQRLDKIRSTLNAYIENEQSIPFTDEEPVLVEALDECDKVEKVEECESEEYEEGFDADEACGYKPQQQIPPIAPSAQSIPNYSSAPREASIPSFRPAVSKSGSIDKFLEHKAETFSTMLLRLIDEKGLKDSEVYKKANIDRRLFSKIRGDEDYVPSKKTAISFCLALQLDLDEAMTLIEAAGYTLSKSSRFDLIIIYLIENSEYNIHFANIVLEDYGEGTLSK